MPLNKSTSEAAFKSNVAEMIRAGHPRAQALAAAYRVQRGHAAGGGVDGIPAFILPPDIALALGHGTAAVGAHILKAMFGGMRIPAETVRAIGLGDINAGRRVLQAFIRLSRKKHAAMTQHRN